MKIYLASASPRRRQLLEQIGIECEQIHADIDETPLENEIAADYVQRLALEKTRAVVLKLEMPILPILGADTAVICEQQILGKPQDVSHAFEMLSLLNNKTHQVMTAITLYSPIKNTFQTVLQISEVTFDLLSAQQINDYIATNEPFDKAGGYGIQGLAATFIKEIKGSYSGVMGLPLFETSALLRKL
jgi:septum formation protein